MSGKWFTAKPCATCPWRKSSTVGGADIPNFDMEKMRNLANTVPPEGQDTDGFYRVMACHGSKEKGEFACAGYLHRHGRQNIAVRALVHDGRIDLNAVEHECKDLELYPDFHTMLADYEQANADSCNE